MSDEDKKNQEKLEAMFGCNNTSKQSSFMNSFNLQNRVQNTKEVSFNFAQIEKVNTNNGDENDNQVNENYNNEEEETNSQPNQTNEENNEEASTTKNETTEKKD